jgi:gliding motility-associated-like protein
MNKPLLVLCLFIILFYLSPDAKAQTNQTLKNGDPTTAVDFPNSGCPYYWFNNTPCIGLPASGIGNISSFTAINNSSTPVVATITAKQVSSGFAYVPSDGTYSNNVSVIDLATNQVISIIKTGISPVGVSVSPDGTRVYITNQGSNSISVINTSTNKVVSTITIPGAFEQTGVVVSPDGSKIFVTNYASASVSVISTVNYALLATIGVGYLPYGIAISLDGSLVYVTNVGDNTVSAINTATNTVISTIKVGIAPGGIYLSPDGSRVYVANYDTKNVSVISTATNTVLTSVAAGSGVIGICVSPDGSRCYASNISDNTVSVINTSTNASIATISVGLHPAGVSLSPDGSRLYVVSSTTKTLSVINTLTNSVVTNIPIGLGATSIGNFISGGIGCNSTPLVFTITVNPASITSIISASTATGTISACAGSSSASPDIRQFTVAGSSLTDNITATAPAGFEISLTQGSGYGNSLTFAQANGKVAITVVYVHSTASDPVGNISGNVVLASNGAPNQNVAVTGVVNALPTVNVIANQTVTDGTGTTAINFSGTGNAFTWVNNTPGIGLPATGAGGGIPSFKVINTGSNQIIANITVTPVNIITGCNGLPTTFTIKIDPSLIANITTSGTLFPLSTIYGTPSPSASITVGGTNLTTGILITSPPGFEISTDNVAFSGTVSVGTAGTITSTHVYLRLSSTTSVGSYSGNILLTSAGAGNVNVTTAACTVTPAPLSIAISNKNKNYGTVLAGGPGSIDFTSSGLKNKETISSITLAYGAGATANAAKGTYTGAITASGASGGTFTASNYIITYLSSDIVVIAVPLIITADNKIKTYLELNPVLTVSYKGFVNNESPRQLTVQPLLSTTALNTSLPGEYTITTSNAASPNYDITNIDGILTIKPLAVSIVVPNTFTPNGDGINDVWDIKSLTDYPQCTVSIFTRYSSLIYQSKGYPKSWDGTFKGNPLPVGTYYYLINLQNGNDPITGPVTIIR